jgi:hypothetical protein
LSLLLSAADAMPIAPTLAAPTTAIANPVRHRYFFVMHPMVALPQAKNVSRTTTTAVLPREYQANRVTSTDTSIAVAAPPEYVPLSGDTSA